MSTDDEIEQEIQAKGLTAPRVTLQSLESCIAYEYYIRGDEIHDVTIVVLGHPDALTALPNPMGSLYSLTICILVLKNGFTVIGESACASPENFNQALGRKIARQKAVEKIWPLEGYLLRQKHSEQE